MKITLLNEIMVFLVTTAGLGIALWCYLVDRRKAVNQLFSALVVLITLNILFSFLFQFPGLNKNFVFPLIRLTWVTGSLLIPVFYFFSIYFPKKIKDYKVLNVLFPSLGIVFLALSLFTNTLIKGSVIQEWGTEIVYGNLITFFYVALILSIVIGLWIIISKYRHFIDKEKLQIKYFLYGISIYLFLSIIFSILIPAIFKTTQYYYFGDYSAIIFLAFTAYAIMKYQLFSIKLIATESVVILLSFALLVEIFISGSSLERSIKAFVWILATYGGWQLIRSVKREIRQREELEILTKKLELANDHLKEVDKLKDDFLSMASHELNTPIAAIKGYLSMILVEKIYGPVTEKMAKPLDTVYQSSVRLANMVKDLLNVSRIESNRIHIIWEQKPIEDIIEQSITEVMSKAKEAKHTLVFEKPKKKMPLTWFDSTRITEVAINILGNAIKYTPDGGKITARVMNDDNKIVISVEDNGKGIPKEKQKSVFEKFTQVDVLKDEVKGTGLGMYIAKRFIELHKGKIWFHSDGDGKGTTFYFSLPVLSKKPYDPHANEGAVLH